MLYSCIRIRVNIQIIGYINNLLSKMQCSYPRESAIQITESWKENLDTPIICIFYLEKGEKHLSFSNI